MPTILVTRKLPSSVVAKLEALGDVEVYSRDGAMPAADLQRALGGKDALVCMLDDQIDRSIVEAGSSLKIIAVVAVGYNNVDVAAARSRGVVVTNTPDVLTDSVADFTWALILALTRRVSEGERLVRQGEWKGWALDFMLGTELRGKQLGVIGFGRIGRAVAARAAAFGVRVAFTSRGGQRSDGGEPSSIDKVLNSSDIVTLHVPLTAETRHLIDRRSLARMKRSAYLVNTSRGPVVDEEALAWALDQHLIAGAALDVFEREPDVHPGLRGLENVLLTPHLGSATVETRTAMADLAVRNVIAVLTGQPALTPVQA